MNFEEQCKLKIKKLFVHDKEKYNFYINKSEDMNEIVGDIKGNLLLHSNIDDLRIKPINNSFAVKFSYFGKFEFIRFRVTTSNPEKDYADIIIYPSKTQKNIIVNINSFDMDDFIVIDFRIFGRCINLSISDIQFDFEMKNEKLPTTSKIIKQYAKKFLVKDYQMLMSPEPHSQERALAVYDLLNLKKNVNTIDLGAGGAPMMSELLLRKGRGTVDAIIYDKDDVRKAKRYLAEYNDRVRIINGDLTNRNSLPCKKYDQVLLLDVLEHIQDDNLVLNNIKHFFKDNTILIATVPNINYKNVMSEEFHNYVGHVRDGYTLNMIKKLFKDNGYDILEAFNFARDSIGFYNLWYNNLKVWSSSYQYSELAYELVMSKFKLYKQKLQNDEGISNCIVCKLK